ncbi:MAG: hypothetical protein ABJO77_21645 [Nisaea sp.]
MAAASLCDQVSIKPALPVFSVIPMTFEFYGSLAEHGFRFSTG